MKALLTYWRQEHLLVFATFFFRNVENLVQEMKVELHLVIVGFAKIDAVGDVLFFC
jgi:hypothetical protein